MGSDLASRVEALRAEGVTRSQAMTQLHKEIALGLAPGATAAEAESAVANVYDEAGRAAAPLAAQADSTEGEADTMPTVPAMILPPWAGVRAVNPPKRAPELIHGLLRRGHVGAIVARAKSGKSWAAVALACAVATGGSWMGHRCERGRVLFLDPELDPRSTANRFRKVADAVGADAAEVERNVSLWSLRGFTVDGRAPSITDVSHDVEAAAAFGMLDGVALVIVDSCSALLGVAADENSSGSVRSFFNVCLRIARASGASIWLVHHEGKQASGDREALARGRGSSAWADCPDLLLSLVEVHPPSGETRDYLADGERAFLLEAAAVREFAPIEPHRLIWRFPVFVEDSEGVTDGWKPNSSQRTAGKGSGASRKEQAARRADACTMALLSHMYRHDIDSAEGIPAAEAARICTEAMGETVTPQTLKSYAEASDWIGVYQRSPKRWAVVPAHPRPSQPRADA